MSESNFVISKYSQLSDVNVGTPAKGDVFLFDGTNYTKLAVGTNGQVLTADSTAATGGKWATPSTSSGTVTSVGLSLPAFLTVTNSPVTTSGTLTGTLATQTANTIFAGPTTGSAAAPTFRAAVKADQVSTTAYTDAVNNFTTTQNIACSAGTQLVLGSGLSAGNRIEISCGQGTGIQFKDGNGNPQPLIIGQAGLMGVGCTGTVVQAQAYNGTLVPFGCSSLRMAGYTVATLPTGVEGTQTFATNGRKVGELAAAGTGVPVYFSNSSWRVSSTDAAVAA